MSSGELPPQVVVESRQEKPTLHDYIRDHTAAAYADFLAVPNPEILPDAVEEYLDTINSGGNISAPPQGSLPEQGPLWNNFIRLRTANSQISTGDYSGVSAVIMQDMADTALRILDESSSEERDKLKAHLVTLKGYADDILGGNLDANVRHGVVDLSLEDLSPSVAVADIAPSASHGLLPAEQAGNEGPSATVRAGFADIDTAHLAQPEEDEQQKRDRVAQQETSRLDQQDVTHVATAHLAQPEEDEQQKRDRVAQQETSRLDQQDVIYEVTGKHDMHQVPVEIQRNTGTDPLPYLTLQKPKRFRWPPWKKTS